MGCVDKKVGRRRITEAKWNYFCFHEELNISVLLRFVIDLEEQK